MSVCKTCGVAINGGTQPRRCGRCYMVETHLPLYLKSERGRSHVASLLADEPVESGGREDTPQDDERG
jgi:hypothetical protein